MAYERASARGIPIRIVGGRAGDMPDGCSAAVKAERPLNWCAALDIDTMCAIPTSAIVQT